MRSEATRFVAQQAAVMLQLGVADEYGYNFRRSQVGAALADGWELEELEVTAHDLERDWERNHRLAAAQMCVKSGQRDDAYFSAIYVARSLGIAWDEIGVSESDFLAHVHQRYLRKAQYQVEVIRDKRREGGENWKRWAHDEMMGLKLAVDHHNVTASELGITDAELAELCDC